MRGDLRRENARIYTEMFEEGIEPFRGTWWSATLMVVCFVLAMLAMLIGFAMVIASPEAFLHDLAPHFFSSPFASGWGLVGMWFMIALGVFVVFALGWVVLLEARARHAKRAA